MFGAGGAELTETLLEKYLSVLLQDDIYGYNNVHVRWIGVIGVTLCVSDIWFSSSVADLLILSFGSIFNTEK